MDMARLRGSRTTICRPFNLHPPRKKSPQNDQLQIEPKKLVRKSKSLNFLFDSNDDIQWNKAAKLRAAALRKKMIENRSMQNETRPQYMDSEQFKQHLANTIDRTMRSVYRLEQLRDQDRERAEQYAREKEEMQQRVANRPSLIERQAREVRRQKLERRYKEVLEKAGLPYEKYRGSHGRSGQTGSQTYYSSATASRSMSVGNLVDEASYTVDGDNRSYTMTHHEERSESSKTSTSNRGTIVLGEDQAEDSSSESSSVYNE